MIGVALAITGGRDPHNLATEMTSRGRGWIELERVLKGASIRARFGGNSSDYARRKIKEIGRVGANQQAFEYAGGRQTVAEYWQRTHNVRLEHPNLPCIRVSANACKSFLTKSCTIPDPACRVSH